MFDSHDGAADAQENFVVMFFRVQTSLIQFGANFSSFQKMQSMLFYSIRKTHKQRCNISISNRSRSYPLLLALSGPIQNEKNAIKGDCFRIVVDVCTDSQKESKRKKKIKEDKAILNGILNEGIRCVADLSGV